MRSDPTTLIRTLIALLVVAMADIPLAQTRDPEHETLLEFFESTGGSTWKRKAGWGSERSHL